MRAFIVTETTLLLLGAGWGIDLLANPQAAMLMRVVTLAVCLVLGLLLGFGLARTVPAHIARLSGTVWLWLYTLLGGWLCGSAVFLWKVPEGVHVWPYVGVAIAFGTLLGCALGLWLMIHNPMRVRPHKPILAHSVAALPEDEIVVPNALIAARKALYAEVSKIQKAADDVHCELRAINADRLAVLYQKQTYVGSVSIYIVCDASYPQSPPEDVFIEVEPDSSTPTTLEYDRHLLDRWIAGTPKASIEALIKDGILQVEESRIG